MTGPVLIHTFRLPTSLSGSDGRGGEPPPVLILGISLYHWGVTEAFELGTDGPKVILAAVDGSTTSLRAGAYAAGLARRQGARLVCVYVGQFSGMAGAAAGAAPGAMVAQEQSLQAEAEDLRKQVEEGALRVGMKIDFIAAQGDPFSEIKRVADAVRADAVIVGSSTKAGHRFVGSLAVRLVRAGRWPVTVVP
jgi:nucleotide-binding universal stress UspA family protein